MIIGLFLAADPVGAIDWEEPVDAPIIDGFRPPAGPYGPGNRGIEYDLEPGTPVYAVDTGRVSFVGRVGSATHVVINHGEGLKSTYAFVSTISVVRGQSVKKGQLVATAGPGFHLTARLWGEYVDPQLLFGGAEIQVNLTDGPTINAPTSAQTRLHRVVLGETVANWQPFSGLLGGVGSGVTR